MLATAGRLLYNRRNNLIHGGDRLTFSEERLQYLELLSQKFPSPAQVSTEIINLNAILGLPKGSEHYISDIHGEYRFFMHILKNASGSVRRKITQCFT